MAKQEETPKGRISDCGEQGICGDPRPFARKPGLAGIPLFGLFFLPILVFVATLGMARPAAAAECPNEAIREQQGSTHLPECRAYEQVSPAQKFGYPVGDNAEPNVELGVSRDGSRVVYKGDYPFEGALIGSNAAFLGQRTPQGWSSSGLLPRPGPIQVGNGLPDADSYIVGETPDQQTTVFYSDTTEPWGSLNIRRADGSVQRIADAGRPTFYGRHPAGIYPGQLWLAGISDDGRHVVFASNLRLLPGLPAVNDPTFDPDILYEWVDDGGSGTLRVVNRTNDSTLTLINPAAAELGGTSSAIFGSRTFGGKGLPHAISDGSDGHSRIFFQNPAPTEESGTGGPVYMREDGSRTVEVSAPTPGHAAATTGLRYLDASADGTKVFFWADSALTDDATSGGGIYRYETNGSGGGGSLVFIGEAQPNPHSGFASATGIASLDGSELFYENGENIMASINGVSRTVVEAFDAGSGTFSGAGFGESFPNNVAFLFGIRSEHCPSANLTPNGRYFLVTGNRNGSRVRVFRYDVLTGDLVDVSTTPFSAGSIYDAQPLNYCGGGGGQPRPLTRRVISDDGSRIFFDTFGALVPEDTNRQTDVYEWNDGVVSLISSGKSPTGSGLAGVDASGDNVFFTTNEALAPQDGDAVADIYDARVGGGFPTSESGFFCEGESCQGSPPASTAGLGAASAAFAGPGNAKAKRAKKRRHHRSATKKPKHKARHGAKKHGHRGRRQQRHAHGNGRSAK